LLAELKHLKAAGIRYVGLSKVLSGVLLLIGALVITKAYRNGYIGLGSMHHGIPIAFGSKRPSLHAFHG